MTKKILALVLAAVLLLTAFCSIAENYSDYSLEELENLQRMIEEEMQKRKDADTDEARPQPEREAPADASENALDQFLNDLGLDTSAEDMPENAEDALGELLGLLLGDSKEAEDTQAPAAQEETAINNDMLDPIGVLAYVSGLLMGNGYMPDMETMLALLSLDRSAVETEDGKLCLKTDPFVVSVSCGSDPNRMTELSVGATHADEKILADMANIVAQYVADILGIEKEQALEILAQLTEASRLSQYEAADTIKGCIVSMRMNPAPDMACLFILSIPDEIAPESKEADAAGEPALSEEPADEPAEPEEPALEAKATAMDSEPMDRSDRSSYVDEGIYQNGIAYEKKGKYERALVIFRHIPEYRNTKEHIEFCESALNNGK